MFRHQLTGLIAPLALTVPCLAQAPPGEAPALGSTRITQADIESGLLSLNDIRTAGLKIFATPFNKLDGYGDGPMNPADPTSPGGRPTLQDNGTFLRVNGLDAQTCMECHSVGSNLTVPFTFAIGGVGGSNNNAIFMPTDIDVDDEQSNGFASFNGRYINPPFLFGSGGVELAGKEMTEGLQRLKHVAMLQPGTTVELTVKGVNFGSISYDATSGEYDTSRIEGIDEDLVVRPFGRKGEFPTVRAFDVGAMNFHFGMQPVEDVGQGVDADGDGVTDEILIGELSALHVFLTNMERPEVRGTTAESDAGAGLFASFGCVGCHVPALETRTSKLTYNFPEIPTAPSENPFYRTSLSIGPAGFDTNSFGGVTVPLFSDLKRHDMGPGLEESFEREIDAEFITARLWGVADTAPYLHDGRATTLTEAILLHGGDAQTARDNFANAADSERISLLAFLRTLRTPIDPATDL